MFTDGLGRGRIREDRGGESYVVVANYGWHQTETAEHARLTAGDDRAPSDLVRWRLTTEMCHV
ncbi:hypothetical protein BIU91_10845 [Curtobacterium sp. MMLR14_002]|nr:hypothetical protein BIU91_10845 [Curtobacterium sp. MMLR14_002]